MAEILVLDIAASKTGALSVLRDFHEFVSMHVKECTDEWIFVTGSPEILGASESSKIRTIVRSDVKASSGARLKFELLNGGAWVNSLKPDIVFSLENMLPRGIDKGIRQVLYIHQPVGFQKEKNFSLFKSSEREQALYQKFYHRLILASAKRADCSVVQTEWMREALIRDAHLKKNRVFKVKPDIPDLSAFVRSGEFRQDSFFYPASDLPYKNHVIIDKACGLLKSRGYAPRIRYTKDQLLPREEVFAEYNRSTLVFPSYIETFGMPLGEARQFGNPILASDTGFSREVLSGYDNAHFFNPFDEKALADLMQEVIEGKIVPQKPCRVDPEESSYSKLVDIILGA